jgi:hypothetical protein
MKKETLEEAGERLQKDKYGIFISKDAEVKGQLVIDTAKAAFLSGMNEGAKWQAERMYSEEDMKEAISYGYDIGFCANSSNKIKKQFPSEKDFFEQFKKK